MRHLDAAPPATVCLLFCSDLHRLRRSAHMNHHFSAVPVLPQQIQYRRAHGGIAAELSPRHPQIDPVFQDPDESDLLRGRLQCHQPLCSQRLRRLGYGCLSQQGYITGGIQQGIRKRFRHL